MVGTFCQHLEAVLSRLRQRLTQQLLHPTHVWQDDTDTRGHQLEQHRNGRSQLIINCTLPNTPQWNFNQNVKLCIEENAFENVIYKPWVPHNHVTRWLHRAHPRCPGVPWRACRGVPATCTRPPPAGSPGCTSLHPMCRLRMGKESGSYFVLQICTWYALFIVNMFQTQDTSQNCQNEADDTMWN